MSTEGKPRRARAVCEFCGRKTRYIEVRDRISFWDLPRGWSSAPYSADFTHPDGTRGSKFTCAKCQDCIGKKPIRGQEGTEWEAQP